MELPVSVNFWSEINVAEQTLLPYVERENILPAQEDDAVPLGKEYNKRFIYRVLL
jgi:hypothetical protein